MDTAKALLVGFSLCPCQDSVWNR